MKKRSAAGQRQREELERIALLAGPARAAAERAFAGRNLGLAYRIARRYRSATLRIDDLEQVAAVGLLEAIRRFDPRRGAAFSTFATFRITHELQVYTRKKAPLVHVPSNVWEDRARIDKARRAAPDASAEELADLAGIPLVRVRQVLIANFGGRHEQHKPELRAGTPAADLVLRELLRQALAGDAAAVAELAELAGRPAEEIAAEVAAVLRQGEEQRPAARAPGLLTLLRQRAPRREGALGARSSRAA